jgi:hypothetical protein
VKWANLAEAFAFVSLVAPVPVPVSASEAKDETSILT